MDKESGLEKEGMVSILEPVDYMAVEEDMRMIGQEEEGKEMEDMLLSLGDMVLLSLGDMVQRHLEGKALLLN